VASVPAIWLVGALHASIHPKSIHALWRAERRGTKMGDVHAGHALQGLMGPTVSWGTLGAHLATAKGARGARVVW
jgi:hypothetical protein